MKGRRGPAGPRPSCARLAYAMLFPFLLALVTGLLFFRQRDLSSAAVMRYQSHRSVPGSDPVACDGWNCTTGEAGIERVRTASTVESANQDNAVAPSSGPNLKLKEGLPPLFLFVGILSGRGYRHRRLAVREAWANRAQIPGVVTSKFVLSEDERTPQVMKEVDNYGDVVFVHEKTNYKSILYKTYFVRVGCWRLIASAGAMSVARARLFLLSWTFFMRLRRFCWYEEGFTYGATASGVPDPWPRVGGLLGIRVRFKPVPARAADAVRGKIRSPPLPPPPPFSRSGAGVRGAALRRQVRA